MKKCKLHRSGFGRSRPVNGGSIYLSRNSFGSLCLILLFGSASVAQNWIQTSAPVANWTSVTCSADGTKIVAAAGGTTSLGSLYISTNSGFTWALTAAPTNAWQAVASSADGRKLAAVVNGGGIYLSKDSGFTWTMADAPSTNWYAIASSGDGTKLIVAAGALPVPFGGQARGPVLLSSDSGASWTDTGLPMLSWTSVGCSTDGTRLLAAPFSGGAGLGPFTSDDSGSTWITVTPPGNYLSSTALSADGTSLLAVDWDFVHACIGGPCRGSEVYMSKDFGTDWAAPSMLPPSPLFLASSADGEQWVAAGRWGDPISISRNSGATWIGTDSPGTNWASVASSAAGDRLVAAVNGGGIYAFQSVRAPFLSTVRMTDNFILSWTIPSTDFILQQNSNPMSTNWTDVSISPMLNLTSLQNQVMLPLSHGNQFYRLKH